jgi:hypothetical protein
MERKCHVSVLKFFAVFVVIQKMGTNVSEERPASSFRTGKISSALRLEAEGSKMLVPICHTTRRYFSVDGNRNEVCICLLNII